VSGIGALPASPSVPTEIEAAFIAGFRSSGEGWNGEYPFEGVADDDFAPVRKAAKAFVEAAKAYIDKAPA
jgi:hypothetical protein